MTVKGFNLTYQTKKLTNEKKSSEKSKKNDPDTLPLVVIGLCVLYFAPDKECSGEKDKVSWVFSSATVSIDENSSELDRTGARVFLTGF